MTKKVIAGYICSDNNQEIEVQKELIKKYASKHKDIEVQFYVDECEPDAEKRLSYLSMIMDMQLGKFTGIVVVDFTDLSESVETLQWLTCVSKKHDVTITNIINDQQLEAALAGTEISAAGCDTGLYDDIFDESGLDDEAVQLILSKVFY